VTESVDPAEMTLPLRLSKFVALSGRLKTLSENDLQMLVNQASPFQSGIGGRTLLLQLDGSAIFVKQIALSDIEQEPQNDMSTDNVFQLPPHYHYGVISLGSGALTNWLPRPRPANLLARANVIVFRFCITGASFLVQLPVNNRLRYKKN